MAKLEFAILQYLEGKGRSCARCGEVSTGLRIVLQRDDKQLLERLQIRVKENLGSKEPFGRKQIEQAIDKAFNGLIQEFKDETVRIV
jgi:hypothetical protein